MVDGTSVLMKLRDLYELEKYLQEAQLEYRDRQQAYFNLYFVELNVGSNEKVDISFNHSMLEQQGLYMI